MMLAPTYIDGSGAVVPQPTVNQDKFLEEILEYNERFLTDMFVETIRIDPILCVYRKWSGISEQRYQAA